MRPCGMLVQRREEEEEGDAAGCDGAGGNGPPVKINVSYGSSQHEIFVPSRSTFGEMKHIVAKRIGLDPAEQRLLFRGKEQEDEEHLHLAGIKDNSKVVVLENPASKEKKLEQSQESEEVSRASEAVAGIRAEVDKLSKRVAELEVLVHDGTKVEEKKIVEPTELLMRQLLKLDGIEAQGEARVQRKAEVRRVQGLVDQLDSLKELQDPIESVNAWTYLVIQPLRAYRWKSTPQLSSSNMPIVSQVIFKNCKINIAVLTTMAMGWKVEWLLRLILTSAPGES
ncbi:BAG family molecular chaperone regulator 4 isoform X1 [Eucalyptus grandis]|uniref:BAG family molecular chaperone regulator 4 isoform X1 n=1 Tax=Eucalyptus grandis TaxID=71139 RepID=UPI00192E9F0A|nr:BAG family molecular chaperone regulator 4 isoform X1 [Eucalyptus grandis]